MVPEGWKIRPLQEIVRKKISYGIVQAGPHVEQGIPYLKSSNVGRNIVISELQKTCPEIHYKYRRSAVHPGDIVFSLRGNIGETSIVPTGIIEANLTQGTARISINKDNDEWYVRYQISSRHFQNRVKALSKGSTFKEISLTDLRKVEILLPPITEQKRIAEILSTWDQAIETTEKLIDNAEAQKKALMQQLLTGKKRLPGFKEEWEIDVFENLFDIKIGGTPSRSVPSYWQGNDGNNLWVAISDLKDKYINDTREKITNEGVLKSNVKLLQPGTVIMSFKLSIGKKAILLKEAYTNEAICGIIPKNIHQIDRLFLFHMLEVINLEFAVDQAVKGKTLNKAKINDLIFSFPKIEEQKTISQLLEISDSEVRSLVATLSNLKKEKTALMQQLLTGKRRVKIEEPAA